MLEDAAGETSANRDDPGVGPCWAFRLSTEEPRIAAAVTAMIKATISPMAVAGLLRFTGAP
jgi:hypothetical protein